ncbi:hypothetical protein Poli38472_004877 [Pythium oligandrum]|uniref:Uncharacterized protein n=1 Tax=Pythium oligandrum TaxID=41045 RepID=A0A8K1CB88_PYTOL|nr:hypothetical protein Poli38472_004877 [Pythium oligandrum]|eukprot:TMW59808.1 hypothetical protein Poli38472_004877 [Pythium oligandrum]
MAPATTEELETLLGVECNPDATLEAALAFVDEFQCQEESQSSQGTASSSPTAGSTHSSSESACNSDSSPARKASQCQETASGKKPRARKPDRQRQELLYLRETVGDLEKKLSELIDEQRRQTQRLAGDSAWANFASRQLGERKRAEEENATLRETYEEQLRLAKSLERMLKKRGYMELLGTDSHKDGLKRARGQSKACSIYSMEQVEADLKRSVQEMYERVDMMFVDPQFAVQDNVTPKRVVELLSDAVTGTMVRSVDSRVLPFDYVETADAIWDFVMDRVHVKATCSCQNIRHEIDLSKSTKTITGQMGWLGTKHQFRVKCVAERYVEPNRVVIVSCMLLEPAQLGDSRIDGIWMRVRAWHIIRRGPNDCPERPSTLKQTYFVATPEIYAPEDDFSAEQWRQESEVGALTDFVLHAVNGQMDFNNQRVENRLADQLLQLQIENYDSVCL